MQHQRARRLWVSTLVFASLTGSCSPSSFDDFTSRDETRAPATECDADARGCGRPEPDGGEDAGPLGALDSSAPMQPAPDSGPPPAAEPRADAGGQTLPVSPPAEQPSDAGPAPSVDAGEPSASTADWPAPTSEALPAVRGCVYAQWCGKTKLSAGAVCRLFPGCQVDEAARKECYGDLEAVCGVPEMPILLCDRTSEVCVTP